MSWTTKPVRERTLNHDRRRIPVRNSARQSGPYPYYGASGVVDHVDGYLFEGLHVLVAEDGENLRTRKTPVAFLADGQFWVNNHAHVLSGNTDNDTRYLAYAIEASDVSGLLSGSTQPKLTQEALGRLQICAPQLEEQRGIAAALGALDDKIESNRRQVRLVAELLDHLVAREAEGLPISLLGDIAGAESRAFNPAALSSVSVDHFSIPAFDERAQPRRVPGGSIKSNKLVIEQPSILVSRLNPTTNRTWFAVPHDGVVACCSMEFLMLRPTPGLTLGAVWLAVRDESFRATLARRATGTSGSHQRVRPGDALRIEVPDVRLIPSQLREEADQLLVLSHQRRAESARLAELRDALLPELLSGRIRVPEAREAVDAAT